ncbi:glycosyltransferase [Acinetobacter colistiniresistens]
MICLSIIIPVYNVEKYIQECLLSIYNQGSRLAE